MTLFLKQSGETNKEALCVKLGNDQGIMRKIQVGCVSRFVNLLGIRWLSSLIRGQVSPIVQHVVVHNGFARDQQAPIVGRYHPVVQEMMALPAPLKDASRCMYAPFPCAHRHRVTCAHARLRVHAHAAA
jgi:hypothetical protein